MRRVAFAVCGAMVLGACAPLPPEDAPEPMPLTAPRIDLSDNGNGEVGMMFEEERSLRLFEDRSARRRGDLVTVIIEEQTAGNKSVSSSMNRSAGAEIPAPRIGDQDLEIAGRPFAFEHEGDAAFEGQGQADQATNLTGTITAVVVDTMPNGHLVIQGEKAVTVSQGQEYVVVSGIVRADDVAPNNTVSSNLIANMQLSYTGSETIDDTTKPGWLTRFLMRRL